MSAPDRIMAWTTFGPESVTGTWSANTFHGSAEPFLKETPARLHAEELAEALREFVDRCERGEILSKRTYAKFKSILAKLEQGAAP